MLRTLAIALLIFLLIIMAGHITLLLLNGAVAISFTVWAILVASIFFFSLAVLLLFLLTWTGILVLGMIALAWVIIAIILFPVLLPVLLPLLAILLFVSYVRRKQGTNEIG